MSNQSGNILSLGLVVILIACSYFSILFLNKLSSIRGQAHILNNFLCAKESNGEIVKHKRSLIRYNNSIRVANSLILVGSMTSNPTISLTAKKLKNSAQQQQSLRHISFLNKMKSLFTKGCHFSPSVVTTYFVTNSIVKLKRDFLGVAIQRKKEWRYISSGKKNTLEILFSPKEIKTKNIIY
jgi:hypothetical protein